MKKARIGIIGAGWWAAAFAAKVAA